MNFKSIEACMKDKVAIITGGTSGIGKASVYLFCAAGVNVVTIGRREELGNEIAKDINTQSGGKCVFYSCDVRDVNRIKEIVDATITQFGKLDILVNCAGYFPGQKPIDQFSIDEIRDIIDTNLIAYLAASKYAIPHLRKSKGNIVNVGSVHGTTSVEGAVSYDATKGAIDAVTRTLAIDEARYGVRVNNIKPGLITTEMFEQTISRQDDQEGFKKYNREIQWLGRWGMPEEVARAILFMASDWASFITGAELLVSGGYEIGEGPKLPNPYLSWNNNLL